MSHTRTLWTTQSPCPECHRLLPAEVVERGDEVVLTKRCPDHGPFEARVSADRRFFAEVVRTTDRDRGRAASPVLSFLPVPPAPRTLFVDLTERCNLSCPVCFADANARSVADLSLAEILERLARLDTRPSISLSGGEPTLRPDLVEIVEAIHRAGFVVKLISNGIRLADERLVAELKRVGLGWVMLQFDGFSDDVYRRTRGRALTDTKRAAIQNLERHRIPMCLGGLQIKGVNDGELRPMFEFMRTHEYVRHLGFTPCSHVGRYDRPSEFPETDSLDTLRAIEDATDGRVRVADFLAFRRLCSTVYRATGNPFFKQKTCFFQLLLWNTGDTYFPANRMLEPRFFAAHAASVPGLARAVPAAWRWETSGGTRGLKLVTIENFRSEAGLDADDAGTCNKYYLTRDGFVPICVHNAWLRGRPAGEAS